METYETEKFQAKQKDIDKSEKFNISLFLTSKLISLLGTYIYSFALALYVLKVTGSGTSFATSVVIGMLPRVVLGPFAGSIADRLDRKKLTIYLDILSGLVVFGLLGVSAVYGLRIPFVYCTSFVLSVISTFYNTALNSAVPNLVRDKSLMRINSYAGAADSISSIVSPILGGFMYALVPINIFLFVNAVSFVFSGVLEIFINFGFNKPDEAAQQSSEQKITMKAMLADTKEVMDFVKQQKAIYTIMKYAVLINFFVNACMTVIFPFIINNELKMSSYQFGIIEGAFSVGVLIMSIVIGKLPEKEKKLKSLVGGLAALGLMIALIGVPALQVLRNINVNIFFAYYMLMTFIGGVAIIIVNVPMNVSFMRLVPDNLRGRAMGLMGTIAGGIGPIGVILAGVLLDIVPSYIILFISGATVIASAIAMLRNKSMQDY